MKSCPRANHYSTDAGLVQNPNLDFATGELLRLYARPHP